MNESNKDFKVGQIWEIVRKSGPNPRYSTCLDQLICNNVVNLIGRQFEIVECQPHSVLAIKAPGEFSEIIKTSDLNVSNNIDIMFNSRDLEDRNIKFVREAQVSLTYGDRVLAAKKLVVIEEQILEAEKAAAIINDLRRKRDQLLRDLAPAV